MEADIKNQLCDGQLVVHHQYQGGGAENAVNWDVYSGLL